MTEIHSCGLAMAMFRQMRKIEPCEQSRDKSERERKDQQKQESNHKLDIVV